MGARRLPEILTVIGATLFIVVLVVSAVWDPTIRWLHFFQAWMYLATIVLVLRQNKWGYFIGISAAGLWNYMSLFANTFFKSGLSELATWLSTGHLARPDQLIAVPAWGSNLLVVVGCVWAYLRHPRRQLSDAGAFALTFVLTTGFFAGAMALFQPRYLALFPRLLHPHSPF
jgi:hypothetical protein